LKRPSKGCTPARTHASRQTSTLFIACPTGRIADVSQIK
jgi:hypothetical protein